MRVALITNEPTPYRVPVFERLAREEGTLVRVFFDGASGATATSECTSFPSERLASGIPLRLRSYQDEAHFAERVVMRFAIGYLPRLAAFRPDVVISGEFGWRTLNAAAYANLAGVPLLVWWEGTPFTERHVGALRSRLRRWLAGRAAGLLGFGSGSVTCLEAVAPAATPVHFVPQAVDNARIAREVDALRGERDTLRESLGIRGTALLCVSRLLPHKGVGQLLDAVRRLRAHVPSGEFTVLLVGDGPLRDLARRSAAALEGHLRVVGAVPPAELSRYLAASDVLVFPTLRDCWGMVVNEALAAGLPVLGSRYAGACEELLLNEQVGCRFDPLVPASFDAVLRAAVVEKRWRGTGADAPRRAVASHTCEAAAAAMLAAARASLARARIRSPA